MKRREQLGPGVVRGGWWQRLEDGRVQCDLCPRRCRLRQGQRGFCLVREADAGGMRLTAYGRASGFLDAVPEVCRDHPQLKRGGQVQVFEPIDMSWQPSWR